MTARIESGRKAPANNNVRFYIDKRTTKYESGGAAMIVLVLWCHILVLCFSMLLLCRFGTSAIVMYVHNNTTSSQTKNIHITTTQSNILEFWVSTVNVAKIYVQVLKDVLSLVVILHSCAALG